MPLIFSEGFSSKEDVAEQFRVDLTGVTIHLAYYDNRDYDAYAYVLAEMGGQLFEVYGSHCSCNGLEGQWDPEPVTIAELWETHKHRHDSVQEKIREYLEAQLCL